jgi:hypothetical protein
MKSVSDQPPHAHYVLPPAGGSAECVLGEDHVPLQRWSSGPPEDHRDQILQDQTEAPRANSKRKRMDRTALSYSVRVGCRVKFTVRVQPGSETLAEIQYYNRQHSGHGPGAEVRFRAVQ